MLSLYGSVSSGKDSYEDDINIEFVVDSTTFDQFDLTIFATESNGNRCRISLDNYSRVVQLRDYLTSHINLLKDEMNILSLCKSIEE